MFGSYRSGIFNPPYLPASPDDSMSLGGGFSLSPLNHPAQSPQRATPLGVRMVRLPPVDKLSNDPGGDQTAQPSTVRIGGGMFAAPPILGPNGMAGINASLDANAALGQQKAEHRHKVMGDIGNALAAGINGYLAAMNNPAGIEGLRQMHEAQMEKQREAADMAQLQAKSYLPQQVGDSLIQLDPAGNYQTLFRDPQPFEAYATSLGYQPGTPEYEQAIQDYRLGSYSDPAIANRTALEGVKYGYRDQLQDDAYGYRRSLQNDRLDVTRRGQDLAHGDRVRGQDLTHGDHQASIRQSDTNSKRTADTQRGAYSYSHPSGKGHGGNEAVAVGPDGKRYVVRNGQWVPLQ